LTDGGVPRIAILGIDHKVIVPHLVHPRNLITRMRGRIRPARIAVRARVCDHAQREQTTFIQIGEHGFWALADAFGAWMGYLVEEFADRAPVLLDPALSALAQKWRVAAVVTDYGADAGDLSETQRAALRSIAVAARARAETVGDLSAERMREWIILDGSPVAGGWAVGGTVELSRTFEVADGFLALLDNELPPDPPPGAWFLGPATGS